MSNSNSRQYAASAVHFALNSSSVGGRLLETYRHENGRYYIEVKGVLEPGPKAERSPTFFLQDGEYQERLFRSIEASHPDIEHLGNWHTHHVNGYPTLSGGDKMTYFKPITPSCRSLTKGSHGDGCGKRMLDGFKATVCSPVGP